MRDFNFPNGRLPLVAALDIEGTLTKIEGWDFLAEKRSKEIQEEIEKMTEEGMNGGDFKKSLFERFDRIQPTPEELEILQKAYCETIGEDVIKIINLLRKEFKRVICISGGLQDAILPFAEELRFDPRDVFSVPLTPQERLPDNHTLYSRDGKKTILDKVIAEERKKHDPQNRKKFYNIMIGDGMTDAVCKGDDVSFIAVGNREKVLKIADFHVKSLEEIRTFFE